jgi:hypothetical protein
VSGEASTATTCEVVTSKVGAWASIIVGPPAAGRGREEEGGLAA